MEKVRFLKEAEVLAKALGKKPEDILALCSEMLNTALASHKSGLPSTEVDPAASDDKMKDKMQMRARRTHGSIKFPV